jgi:hypothetical protein
MKATNSSLLNSLSRLPAAVEDGGGEVGGGAGDAVDEAVGGGADAVSQAFDLAFGIGDDLLERKKQVAIGGEFGFHLNQIVPCLAQHFVDAVQGGIELFEELVEFAVEFRGEVVEQRIEKCGQIG